MSVAAAAATAGLSSSQGRNFQSRTLVKKTVRSGAAAEEYPSDLDDLSDADFSDEDRDAGSSDQNATDPADQLRPNSSSSSTSTAASILGPAARQLNEFDITPSLLAELQACEASHQRAFGGLLARVMGSADDAPTSASGVNGAYVRTLLGGDSMTPALRADFVQQRFDISFILSCTQAFAATTSASADPLSPTAATQSAVPPQPRHHKAASAATLTSPQAASTVVIPASVRVAAARKQQLSPPQAHNRGKSSSRP
jgi:hypothetical protein